MSDIKVIELIQVAIQMESDAQSFYLKNAVKIPTEIGRTMFVRFAQDETIHLETFRKIIGNVMGHAEVRAIENARKKYIELPIFPKELNEVDWANPDRYELDALHQAMDAEMDAIKYYLNIQQSVDDQLLRKILGEIIRHENTHHSLLHWQFSYLSQTGQWDELTYLKER